MLKFVQISSVILLWVGVGGFTFGYVRYLLIFPQGAFKILQYWWMKDYFSPDEWVVAKKCIKIMFTGLAVIILNILFLLFLNSKFSVVLPSYYLSPKSSFKFTFCSSYVLFALETVDER